MMTGKRTIATRQGGQVRRQQYGPVDFAIVTALPLERDAVLQRLDDFEDVRLDGEPLTYYLGHIGTPRTGERYSVVVVMLLNMGNDEAAVATTRLIKSWHPANVLMVGIAGGVEDRVKLGDVVVSRFCFYYELAKMTPAGPQIRGEYFPSSFLLFGQAMAYEAGEWKSDIRQTRPGESPQDSTLPTVHTGPIASGEKVIADDLTLPPLLQLCPKLLAMAMEGAGVGRACAYEDPQPRFMEVRGICDLANSQKNDVWQPYAAHAAAAFVVGFLRSRPIVPPSASESATALRTPLLVLRAQSLVAIPADAVFQAFDDDLRGRDVQTVPLDFTDLAPRGQGLRDPAEAVRRLTDPKGSLLGALAQQGDDQLVFHGIVHIPLAVLAGHLVSDRQPVRFFDFHPDVGSGTWSWPAANDEPFPEFRVAGLPRTQPRRKGAAVVRVSVSYLVAPQQTNTVVPDPILSIGLSVLDPGRGIVRGEAQTRAYGRAFRQVLDTLARYSGVERVHLFYAGPVSLAFHLGQQVSENIHPPVTTWNYSRDYDWGIDLAAAVIGDECIIRAPRTSERGLNT